MHQQAIETICSLEDQLDTQSMLYGTVNYWPICRLRLWSQLISNSLTATSPEAPRISNGGPTFPDVGQVKAFPFARRDLGLVHINRVSAAQIESDCLPKPDLVFFLRPEEYRDEIGGRAYAKMLDSVYGRATAYRRLKIELANPQTMPMGRYNESAFLHAPLITPFAESDPPYECSNFELLSEALRLAGYSGIINAHSISEDMSKIFYYARIFEVALRALLPKAVFLSVYYHPVGMGLMLAARRLNITTVDVQHGRLGPHHGLYTQLTAAPESGYDLLPDHVWCWGAQTKHDVDIDKAINCRRHGGVIGGNPWLDRWLKGDPPEQAASPALKQVKSQAEKRILVSLQPWETPLPAFVLEAMANSPPDWRWWLRLHPLRRHTAPEITSLLDQHGISNYNVADATDLPLFSLLKTCDHHVTAFSSVAMEALAFGLRTTLFTETGHQIFLGYVNARTFSVAYTSDALVSAIKRDLASPPVSEDHPFIDTRSGLAESALATILSTGHDSHTSAH